MADDLGARLLRAGLVTRDQLAETLSVAPSNGGALVAALAARGVPEDALAGFFLAEGFGPLMEASDLGKADPAALRRLPGDMAVELLALPVRASPAGLVVAMAAPSDRHAVREIARVVGGEVLPTIACVTPLEEAIRAQHPDAKERSAPPVVESEPPVLELVRRRGTPSEGVWAGSSGGAEGGAKLGLGPRLATSDDDVAVPLVRTKPMTTPAHGISIAATPSAAPEVVGPSMPSKNAPRVITKSFARPDSTKKPSTQGLPRARAAADAEPAAFGERRGTAEYQVPPADGESAEGPASQSAGPPQSAGPQSAAPKPAAPKTKLPAPYGPLTFGKRSDPAPKPADAKPAPADDAKASKDAASTVGAPKVDTKTSTDTKPATVAPEPEAPSPPTSSKPPKPATIVPPEHERWDIAAAAPPPARAPAAKLSARAAAELPRGKAPPPEIGTMLAAMRGATDRDEVVRLACEAAVTVSRAAVFLALRKGVLKGWDGLGAGISRDAVRNLWIPTTSASTFKKVLETAEPYVGPYGTAVADGLFRAAVASRGGLLAVHPVSVADKVVGVLAVDDLSTAGSLPKHRIEIVAHAVAEAFKRILSTKKG